MALIPLIVSVSGKDTFRLPKEAALRLAAAIIVALFLAFGDIRNLRWDSIRRWVRSGARPLVIAGLVWTVIVTALSTNRVLSSDALISIASLFVLFLALERAMVDRGLGTLYVAFLPAAINAVLITLQRFRIWNPFFSTDIAYNPTRSDLSGLLKNTALIGNSNYVGSYLLVPALAAVILASSGRRLRPLHIAIAVVLGTAVLITQTLTAIAAFILAILAFLFITRGPALKIAAVVLAVIAVVGVVALPRLLVRFQSIQAYARAHNYDAIISGRSAAFIAALRMFRDHPVFGVGPRCFAWHYFRYKVAAEESHPALLDSPSRQFNFGEVHNDHLQILAEAGAPGLLLFWGGLGWIAYRSRLAVRANEERPHDPRREFVKRFALPFAVGVFFLCLGQFPFTLPASAVTCAFFAAIVSSWSRADA